MNTETTQISISVLRNQLIGIYSDTQKKLVILFVVLFVQAVFTPIGLPYVLIFVTAFLLAGFHADLELRKKKELELIKVGK